METPTNGANFGGYSQQLALKKKLKKARQVIAEAQAEYNFILKTNSSCY